jgi:hypothetical protein
MISSMKSVSRKLLPALFCLFLAARLQAVDEPTLSPLPVPLTNNAVAISHDEGGPRIFSFMGIGPKKTWDAVTTSAYEMDPATGKWQEVRPVPGVAGRIAASAVALHDQVFIFGGYILDSLGGQTAVSDLNVFVPVRNRYYRGKDIPEPVADAVVGVYRDRYIFLIGGWSTAKGAAVRNVQVYDTDNDTWTEATPLPGTPVFGHAGAILGDTIVYVDGAYKNPSSMGPKFLASSECWMGEIPKKGGIANIEWTRLAPHPGNARFRIAAGAGPLEKKGGKIYFSGGAAIPYNFNGIGYDGRPAEPSPVTFAFDDYTGDWETINVNINNEAAPNPTANPTVVPTMDHRGLLVMRRGLVVVGGMEKGQQVTAKVTVLQPEAGK